MTVGDVIGGIGLLIAVLGILFGGVLLFSAISGENSRVAACRAAGGAWIQNHCLAVVAIPPLTERAA